jgi:hypothetical protein
VFRGGRCDGVTGEVGDAFWEGNGIERLTNKWSLFSFNDGEGSLGMMRGTCDCCLLSSQVARVRNKEIRTG